MKKCTKLLDNQTKFLKKKNQWEYEIIEITENKSNNIINKGLPVYGNRQSNLYYDLYTVLFALSVIIVSHHALCLAVLHCLLMFYDFHLLSESLNTCSINVHSLVFNQHFFKISLKFIILFPCRIFFSPVLRGLLYTKKWHFKSLKDHRTRALYCKSLQINPRTLFM